MDFRIRAFQAEDAPAVVDLFNLARPVEVARLTEERFWAWYGHPDLAPERDVLVAVDAEGPVGVVMSFPWPSQLEEGTVFFVGPSVLPEAQRHGVGAALMRALIDQTRTTHPGLRLQTRLPQNSEAAPFLVKLGFRLDRHFWWMTHPAPGKAPATAPPAGVSFDYLGPEADLNEAVAAYREILDDPLTHHHLLNVEELRRWAGLRAFLSNSFELARVDGRVIGICFQIFPAGGDDGQIQFLGVLPEFRGRGVATHLLTLALANASANGKRTVRLEVSGGDDTAQALYRSLGFEVTGGETFYELPLGAEAGVGS